MQPILTPTATRKAVANSVKGTITASTSLRGSRVFFFAFVGGGGFVEPYATPA